eukprot:3075818-Alexandrium_andersonii.AAC.1
MLGPDQAPSGRGPAPAGAGALGAKNLDKPRVSWADTIDACDGTQYATVWSEPVSTGVAPHEHQEPPEGDRLPRGDHPLHSAR